MVSESVALSPKITESLSSDAVNVAANTARGATISVTQSKTAASRSGVRIRWRKLFKPDDFFSIAIARQFSRTLYGQASRSFVRKKVDIPPARLEFRLQPVPSFAS